MRKDLQKMEKALKQVKNPVQAYTATGAPYTRSDTKKFGINSNTYTDFAVEHAFSPTKKEVKSYKKSVRKQNRAHNKSVRKQNRKDDK